MRGRLATAALALALAGCASSGPTGNEILTGSIQPTAARLVIYRSSALGMAVQPSYTINGHAVAGSQPNGFVVCDLKPGRYDVGVNNFAVNINLFGGSDKAQLDLKPGTTTFVHAQPQMGVTVGIITLSHVSEQQGRSDTAALHKIEGSCPAA